MSRYVGAAEAARLLGVQRPTLYAYVSRGLIERRTAVDGRTSLYAVDDLERLAGRGRRPRQTMPPPSLDVQIVSSITLLGDGPPRYRGHDAAELARSASFEQVAELLWSGVLGEHRDWSAPPPGDVAAVRAAVATTCPGDPERATAVAALLLSTRHPDDTAPTFGRRLLALLPDVVRIDASSPRVRARRRGGGRDHSPVGTPIDGQADGRRSGQISGQPAVQIEGRFDAHVDGPPDAQLGTPLTAHVDARPEGRSDPQIDGRLDTDVDAHVGGRLATRLAAAWAPAAGPALSSVLKRALILLADHELTTSTMAVRLAASVRAGIGDALAAGLAVLRGPLHGSASAAVHRTLEACERDGVTATLHASIDRNTTVPGFGHKIYAQRDPRLDALEEAVAMLPDDAGRLEVVERFVAAASQRVTLAPNVDLGLGALTFVAGLPPAAPIFAVARIPGLIAHYLEELEAPPLRYRAIARPPT